MNDINNINNASSITVIYIRKDKSMSKTKQRTQENNSTTERVKKKRNGLKEKSKEIFWRDKKVTGSGNNDLCC